MAGRIPTSFLMTAAVVFLVFSASVANAKNCLTGGCHQKLTEVRYMHGPVAAEMANVKACEMCHVRSGSACTSSKGGSYKLKGQDMCSMCHAQGTGTQHSEAGVNAKCLSCHNPHGSDSSPHMLRSGRSDLIAKK